LVVVSLLFFGVFETRSQTLPPTIERTTNKQTDELVKFFHVAALSLQIEAKGAHFVTRKDGPKFVNADLRDHEAVANKILPFEFDFTISHVGQVFSSPDHHGMRIFRAKQIMPNALVLEYESSFDHRSFSKNLITIDTGELTLHSFNNGNSKE
jgi:hypothetical protein